MDFRSEIGKLLYTYWTDSKLLSLIPHPLHSLLDVPWLNQDSAPLGIVVHGEIGSCPHLSRTHPRTRTDTCTTCIFNVCFIILCLKANGKSSQAPLFLLVFLVILVMMMMMSLVNIGLHGRIRIGGIHGHGTLRNRL